MRLLELRPSKILTSLSPQGKEQRSHVTTEIKAFRKQLAQEDREWRERADRAMKEYREMRDREPKVPLCTLKEWREYFDMRRQQDAEARARGEDPTAIKPAPLVPEIRTTAPLTPGLRRARNHSIVQEQYTRLVNEVQKGEFDLIAKDIRATMWHDPQTLLPPLSTVKPDSNVRISIKDDGTVIDRSQLGVSLVYPFDGKRKKEREDRQENRLRMGIGYFGDRSQIIPEAQGAISDEDLVRGVKAYYVQRTYVDKATSERKTEIIVVPLAYADAQQTFFKHLYDSSVMLAPERMLPPQRARRYQRTALAA